jgi:O-antigen/teichoic acid export membrane protein
MIKFFFEDKAFLIFLQRSILLSLGFITSLLLAINLDSATQGYYFAMGSLISSYNLIELGLPYLLVQLSTKFYSNKKSPLKGNVKDNVIFFSFIYRLKNYLTHISLLTIAIFIPLGFAYFSHSHSEKDLIWVYPWIFIVCATSISIPINSFLSVIESFRDFKFVYYGRISVSLLSNLIIWYLITTSQPLYAVGLSCLITSLIFYPLMFYKYRFLLFSPIEKDQLNKISWKEKIWPIQKNASIMIVANYIFYFTPTLIIFYNSHEEAGRLGLSIVIASSIVSLSSSSMQSAVSKFTHLYNENKIQASNLLFFKEYKKSLLITFMLFSLFPLFYFVAPKHFFIFEKVLNFLDMTLLFLNFFIMQALTLLSYFYRARNQDPAAFTFLFSNILVLIISFFVAPFYGVSGVLIVTLIVFMTFVMPLIYKYYLDIRNKIYYS